MKSLFSIILSTTILSIGPVAAQSSEAEMISDFRLEHGEGRVLADATLNRIALEQAQAMASRDKLDHDVLGSFSSRIAVSGARHAAENIAYGYDGFEKTLGQWTGSAGHRKNLLLHTASRVGVASAKSANTHRTYWAMEIAGGYEQSPPVVGKKKSPKAVRKTPQSCRAKILGICL